MESVCLSPELPWNLAALAVTNLKTGRTLFPKPCHEVLPVVGGVWGGLRR